MNHVEFASMESSMLDQTNCERWLSEVEKCLGHSLDGDEDHDGYSLDGAVKAYESGVWKSEAEYARAVENSKESPISGPKDLV